MFALVLATMVAAASGQPGASPPQSRNPTVVENARPGDPDWEVTQPALEREIEGYASRTSVNTGEPIEIFVSTRDPRYTVEVFRMGWYGGAGARRVAGPFERDGVLQDMPQPDRSTGLVECRWRDPIRLDTRGTGVPGAGPPPDTGAGEFWRSGVYLARLTARPSARQAFVVFVVRDDARTAAIVFQSSVTTFAAYNNWGGSSLYAFNSGNRPARKVSFDRPYAMNPYGVRLDGAGDFLRRWEYNAVRFLERDGYDVTYVTNVDVHERADGLLQDRVFLSVGHDEYWSSPMRQHVEAARDRGVHLVFLGSGTCYWQIRFEPSGSGGPNRTLVAYKEAAGDDDPLAIDGNPQNDRLITGRWRDRPVSRPEERLVGVMYAADPVDGDIIVDDAAHWVFAGSGLRRGDVLRGLLGYEVDAIYGGGPRTIERLAHSPYVDRGRTRYADMTIYAADSGAIVFATGSMQWSWGLDGYNAPVWHPLRASGAAQRVTRNVLDRMLRGPGEPRPAADWRPSAIVVIALAVAIIVVLRAWLSRSNRATGR
jgi:hypothetical protein